MVTEFQVHPRARICQTCGDEGYKDLLHCCIQCHISVEHRYCFAENPANVDEYFSYICPQCDSLSVNQTSPKCASVFCPRPPRLRKPKRPRVEQPAELVDELEVPQGNLLSSLRSPVSNPIVEELLPQADLDHYSPSNRDINYSPSDRENGEVQTNHPPPFPQTCGSHVKDLHPETKRSLRKPKRQRVEQPAELVDDEVQVPTGVLPSPPTQVSKPFVEATLDDPKHYNSANSKEAEAQMNLLPPFPQTLICDPYPETKRSVNKEFQTVPVAPIEQPVPKPYAQPIIEPSWRGCFEICGAKLDDLAAHLSNTACLKVAEAAKLMPKVISTKMVPRLEIWPKSFSETPPTDQNIGMYLFPGSEDAVKAFDQLMGQIIKLDRGLKVVLDHAELLLFSSNQLPPRYWRFSGKYYLWGAFRARQDPASSSSSRCSVAVSSRKIDIKINSPDSLTTTSLDSPRSTSSISALTSKTKKPTESTRMSPVSPLTKTSSYYSFMSREKEENKKLQKADEKINTLPLRTKIVQHENNWRIIYVSPLIKISSNEKSQISHAIEQRAPSINQPKVASDFKKEHFNPFQPMEKLVKKNHGQKEVNEIVRLVKKDLSLLRPQTVEKSVKKDHWTNAEKCPRNMKNHPRGEEGTWRSKRGKRGRNRCKRLNAAVKKGVSKPNETVADYCYFCNKAGHLKSQCWTFARAVKERKIAV